MSKSEGVPTASQGWVSEYIAQYPELLWLAREDVRKTEEGVPSEKELYSEELFGEKFIEFDRTLMAIRCLRCILDGNEKAYEQFTAAQSEEERLSRKSFSELHEEGVRILRSRYRGLSYEEMLQSLEVALILGDMGKSGRARELFSPYGAKAPDHDDFYVEALAILKEHPELSPSFSLLCPAARELLYEGTGLAHYGHITHLEGGPGMFSKLKGVSSKALCFDLFVHACDVAGARGHVNNHSSLVYTEPTYRAMRAVADACQLLSDPEKSEWVAYEAYLGVRAKWLGLDPASDMGRVLTRLGAMLRFSCPEDGELLKEAFSELSEPLRKKILTQLDYRKGEELGRTPTYVPAVLVNLFEQDKKAPRKERVRQAVLLGVPFISKALEQFYGLNVPLNFNEIARIAKNSPALLLCDCTIDEEGLVGIEKKGRA